MKNVLKSEIEQLSEKILITSKLNNLDALQEFAKSLYDKITVLQYLDKQEGKPTNTDTLIPKVVEATIDENENLISTLNEDLFVANESVDSNLLEPATEKMIDIIAQLDEDAGQVDELLRNVMDTPEFIKNDMEDLSPLTDDIENNDQKSLNDRLKKGITIGLNDRIAFVKHLFNGSTEDFNRVMSQLNTLQTELEALEFLNNMVKPEYSNWAGKETYEERFISFIEGKF